MNWPRYKDDPDEGPVSPPIFDGSPQGIVRQLVNVARHLDAELGRACNTGRCGEIELARMTLDIHIEVAQLSVPSSRHAEAVQ